MITPLVSVGSPDAGADSHPRVRRDSCPLCGKQPERIQCVRDGWELAGCTACDFSYLVNPPDYAALTAEFEWDRSWRLEKLRRRRARGLAGEALAQLVAWLRTGYRSVSGRNKLHRLAREAKLSGETVDVGCGDGVLWERLPVEVVPVGIELSPVLAAQARLRLRDRPGRLIEADALGGLRQLPERSMNGAMAISFLEHEIRPVEVLREIRRTLRPGGALLVKVPNFACWNRQVRGAHWCGFRFPDHVNYFTPRSLRGLLEASGFALVRFRRRDRLPTSDNMWCVARALGAAVAGFLGHPEWVLLAAV